jgi:hypothetical protein
MIVTLKVYIENICVLSGILKPHCIQSSRVLVPAGTKSMSCRHGIQAVTRVMAYVADAVTL